MLMVFPLLVGRARGVVLARDHSAETLGDRFYACWTEEAIILDLIDLSFEGLLFFQ